MKLLLRYKKHIKIVIILFIIYNFIGLIFYGQIAPFVNYYSERSGFFGGCFNKCSGVTMNLSCEETGVGVISSPAKTCNYICLGTLTHTCQVDLPIAPLYGR